MIGIKLTGGLLVAVLVTGWAWAARDTVREPRIVQEGTLRRLELPDTMRAALRAYDASFRPWAEGDYTAEARARYPGTQTPFAVVADFNGDGTADVVIHGRSNGYTATVALVTQKGGCRIVEISHGGAVRVPEGAVAVSSRAPRGFREEGLRFARDYAWSGRGFTPLKADT